VKMCMHVGLDLLIVLWYGRLRTRISSQQKLKLSRVSSENERVALFIFTGMAGREH